MTWPDFILEQFGVVSPIPTDEMEYYGPSNTLLGYLFPATKHYQVTPVYRGQLFSGSLDFTALFIVKWRRHPIFFIQIKDPDQLDLLRRRAAADSQVHDRLRRFADSTIISTSYGLSALGTRLCVYEYDEHSRRISPPVIARDLDFINDQAPAARWNVELLSDKGEAKLRNLAVCIEVMCSQL